MYSLKVSDPDHPDFYGDVFIPKKIFASPVGYMAASVVAVCGVASFLGPGGYNTSIGVTNALVLLVMSVAMVVTTWVGGKTDRAVEPLKTFVADHGYHRPGVLIPPFNVLVVQAPPADLAAYAAWVKRLSWSQYVFAAVFAVKMVLLWPDNNDGWINGITTVLYVLCVVWGVQWGRANSVKARTVNVVRGQQGE